MNKKRIHSAGVALGGGAARGWAHIGVIQALTEKNISISHIAGTSIGAFVGSFLASGTIDRLLENVLPFTRRQSWKYLDFGFSKAGIMSGRRITSFLEKNLGVQTFADITTPFATVAADLRTGREVIFSQGSLVEAVRASIAVPGVFTPVQKGDLLLSDGGLVNPVPVNIVRRLGADFVIAVDLNAVPGDDVPVSAAGDVAASEGSVLSVPHPNVLSIAGASANIIQARLTELQLRADPPDLLICPNLSRIGYMDFTKGEIAVKAGYDAAVQCLNNLG